MSPLATLMRLLREWAHRVLGVLRPARRDDDLAEELRLHMEMAAEGSASRRASG